MIGGSFKPHRTLKDVQSSLPKMADRLTMTVLSHSMTKNQERENNTNYYIVEIRKLPLLYHENIWALFTATSKK